MITDRMQSFLKRMAACENGKGLPLRPADRRIASNAISRKFGMTLGFGSFEVFVISDEGRTALAKANGHD